MFPSAFKVNTAGFKKEKLHVILIFLNTSVVTMKQLTRCIYPCKYTQLLSCCKHGFNKNVTVSMEVYKDPTILPFTKVYDMQDVLF